MSHPNRRQFLQGAGTALALSGLPSCALLGEPVPFEGSLIVSTWNFGARANDAAWAQLAAGVAHPLDAAVAGVAVVEADPNVSSVGLGGQPNAEGIVELDSAVMRGDTLACGGVAALRGIAHPAAVARAVMERTRHVLLVGEGAKAFALAQGFPERHAPPLPAPPDASGDHDTIGLIVLQRRRFAAVVSTSGLAGKLPGRVGDSPIVGAGLYCDDEAGAAVATGVGEEMIRTCACFAVVERMRQGSSAGQAVQDVVAAVARHAPPETQVALLAVDRAGGVGAFGLRQGFQYALTDEAGTRLIDAGFRAP